MKICYVPRKFQAKRQILIDQSNEIIEEYQAQGYELTTRQVYYQFVARDLLPEKWRDPITGSKNNPKSYGKLSSIINKARLAGLIDWKAIVDRTREPEENQHWDSPKEIIDACVSSYKIDSRKTQPYYIEVWVEKEALEGVIRKTCRPLDVLSFACKGYVSQSSMWEAAQRIIQRITISKENYIEQGLKKAVIFHLGDHDPSGMDMTRDIQDRLNLFVEADGIIEVRRIALNFDQIKQYNPPPNPVKMTDSRKDVYIEKYGEESWELDALEPKVLDELITTRINKLTDVDLLEEAGERQEEEKAVLRKIANKL